MDFAIPERIANPIIDIKRQPDSFALLRVIINDMTQRNMHSDAVAALAHGFACLADYRIDANHIAAQHRQNGCITPTIRSWRADIMDGMERTLRDAYGEDVLRSIRECF